MDRKLRLLILEDRPEDVELMVRELKGVISCFDYRHVDDEQSYLAALDELRPHLILCDYSLSAYDGLSALSAARDACPDAPFIFVSDTIGDEAAIETLKRGATDYVLKNRLYRLGPAVTRALEEAEQKRLRLRAEEELRQTNTTLRTLIESSPLAIVVVDRQIRVTLWNPAAEALFGWDAGEVVGEQLPTIPPERKDEIRMILEGDFKGNMRQAFETRRRCKSGELVEVSLWTVPLFNGQDEIVGVMGMFVDIGERKKAEREAKRLTTAIEQSHDWVLITDPEGTILYANRAVERISGFPRKEIIGRNPRIFKSKQHDTAYFEKMWKTVLSGRSFRAIFINRRKSGEIYYLDQTVSALTDKDGRIINLVATGKDITRQRRMEERLNYLAYYDVLTGLANRSLYIDRLGQAIARARHVEKLVATLIIDIDRFKYINDSLGSAVGDEVLKEVSRRLTRMVREGDTVARLGGDEFGVVLIDIAEASDVFVVFEKLIREVSKPFTTEEEEIVTSFSIGIAVFPNDGADAEALMRSAEVAFTEAKKQKGNSHQFFAEGMNVTASEFLKMERDLARAIREEEFRMHYQPYFDASGKMVGIESLIRWYDPAVGMRGPGEFIPVLEESGLILQVGNWILETVCGQVGKWLEEGHAPVPVAVNLSPLQFRDEQLTQTIESILEESAIPPRLLTLEVTESSFIHDIEYTRTLLRGFAEMGMSLSLDDFGTGYSSLSYVASFPFQMLKIDISFIRNIAREETSATIVSAIISMAHDLGLKTIAEGVENATQFEILCKLGCDMVQGFYFCKPVTAEEMGRKLAGEEMRPAEN